MVGCHLFLVSFKLSHRVLHPQIEKREQLVEGAEEDQIDCHCKQGLTIYLSYTSNLISSGVRESICYLAEHKMVRIYTIMLLLVSVTD